MPFAQSPAEFESFFEKFLTLLQLDRFLGVKAVTDLFTDLAEIVYSLHSVSGKETRRVKSVFRWESVVKSVAKTADLLRFLPADGCMQKKRTLSDPLV